MMYNFTMKKLREIVLTENLRLVEAGLVKLTWGNVSAIDRGRGLVAIKPSGVSYSAMKAEDIVIVDLDGNIVEGALRPSSDLATHLEIYRNFDDVGGVVHTHSSEATGWAQAAREIPVFGTTHADCFNGPVPLTRYLTPDEVSADYEGNTGKVIVETFAGRNPMHFPGVLVAGHGPFTWGKDAAQAVDNAVSLEEIAHMARLTIALGGTSPLPDYVLDKHFQRKHGSKAYYGQGGE